MARKNMGINRKIVCSSSIENWREKIESKLKDYNGETVLFFGLYHSKDYQRFLECKNKKAIFWQGSDILQLKDERIKKEKAKHFCENKVCQKELRRKGIKAGVKYIFWGDSEKYIPQAWTCMHEGREKEYGIEEIRKMSDSMIIHIYGIGGENEKNIIYHGKVSEEQMDSEIKNCQIAIRLNKFDGMSEVIIKGILLGQKIISKIKYPEFEREKWIKIFNEKIL